jgi:hypothetical protein
VPDTDTPRPTPRRPGDHPDQPIDHKEPSVDQTAAGDAPQDAPDDPEQAVVAWPTVLLDRRRRLCLAYAHGLDEATFDTELWELDQALERFAHTSARAAAPRVRPRDSEARQADLLGRRLHLGEFTWADRMALLSAQNWRCAICDRQDPAIEIDVDPGTLMVRGMVCLACHRALALLGDDVARVERAARYLAGEGPAEAPAPDAPR